MQTGVWTKASKSQSTANCVEMRRLESGVVAVRNSRNPEGATLLFTADEFDAWIDGAKKGEYDA